MSHEAVHILPPPYGQRTLPPLRAKEGGGMKWKVGDIVTTINEGHVTANVAKVCKVGRRYLEVRGIHSPDGLPCWRIDLQEPNRIVLRGNRPEVVAQFERLSREYRQRVRTRQADRERALRDFERQWSQANPYPRYEDSEFAGYIAQLRQEAEA